MKHSIMSIISFRKKPILCFIYENPWLDNFERPLLIQPSPWHSQSLAVQPEDALHHGLPINTRVADVKGKAAPEAFPAFIKSFCLKVLKRVSRECRRGHSWPNRSWYPSNQYSHY